MFDKETFSNVLKKINSTYSTMTEFAQKADFDRTYISKYINMKLDNPPSPKILEKIANASNNITSYVDLMIICGYSEKNLESIVYNIYTQLKNICKTTYKSEDCYEVESSIEKLQDYCLDLIKTIEEKSSSPIYLINYFDKCFFLEDYNYVCTFLILYEKFLKCLEKEKYITLINYKYSNWSSLEIFYTKINTLEKYELLSYANKQIQININFLTDFINYIKKFSTAINLAFLSDFDNNALTELFKAKTSLPTDKSKKTNLSAKVQRNNLHMVPIVGKIAAGKPILANEYIEGYLPMDPSIYGLNTSDDLFFLKVSGESMNLKVHNGDYALIHKQDYAENGDIIVAVVNGDDEATLKRYKRINDEIVMLEPMSTYPMEPIIINLKETNFKIIGKAIGQFGKF